MSAAQSQMIQTEKQYVYTYVLQIERGEGSRKRNGAGLSKCDQMLTSAGSR